MKAVFLQDQDVVRVTDQFVMATKQLDVESFSGADTLDFDNDVALCDASGGTFALTLPTAVGITGKIFHIVKEEDSSTSITINTTSSQTIGIRSSGDIGLNRLNDRLSVVSDGSNWEILAKIETEIITAAGTAAFSTFSTGDFPSMAGGVTLGEGKWRIVPHYSVNIGTSTGFAFSLGTGLYSADGADSASTPALVSAGTNVSTVDGEPLMNPMVQVTVLTPAAQANARWIIAGSPLTIVVNGGTQAIHAVPNVAFGVAGTGTCRAHIVAERLPE